MARRKPHVPKVLHPPQEEVDTLREKLVAHYKAFPGFSGDPLAKADWAIEASRKGWANCPKTFEKRVRTKAKMHHAGGANLRNRGELTSQKASREGAIEAAIDSADPLHQPAIEEVIDHIGRDKVLRALKAPDKKFWKQREKYYRREFEFNSSSDFTLLIEVISNELKIAKIHEMEFEELERAPDSDKGIEGPDPQKLLALSKMTSEAHKQLADSLKSLGVTRDQRRDELENADGDISSLSLSLDKKLAAVAAVQEADRVEEEAGLKRKYLRGDVHDIGLDRAIHNRIPNADEVAEIISESGIHSEDDPGAS